MVRSKLVLLTLAATVAAGAQTPLPAPLAPPVSGQRLAPGDLIAVSVFEAPELATSARLDAGGGFTMPETGRVELAGLSAPAAAAAIARRLQADYLQSPEVTVLVQQFAAEPVTVLGAVRNPGVYSVRDYPDLAALLAAAGGPGPASGAKVLISHGQDAVRELPVAGFLSGTAVAPPIAAGDVIRVLPAATVYVGGDVARPGAYPLPATGLTLVEALSLAGGIQRDGQVAHTRIVHTAASDGPATVRWLDARPILAGRAADVRLQPFDLVYVPHSLTRATVFRGLKTSVAAGVTILTGLIVFH